MTRATVLLALLLASCGAPNVPVQQPAPQVDTSADAAPAPAATATPVATLNGRLAFARNHDLWLLQGGSAMQLTNLGAVQNPSWSPDGATLAFDRAGKNSADLWLLPFPDGPARALTANASSVVDNNFWEMQPDWSPDGRSLVYASDRGRTRTGTLDLAVWRIAVDGKARMQLTGANAYTGGVDRPRWRPASKGDILYTSWTYVLNDPDAFGELALLRPETNKAWTLSAPRESVMQANWSPDGSHVAVVRRSGGQDQIWVGPVPMVVGADTDVLHGATAIADGINAHPVWSPKGNAIAYISLRDGSFDLFAQPLTPDFAPDGGPRQLTKGLHIDADSSISWAA